MKKFLFAAFIFFAAIIFLPSKTSAQYTTAGQASLLNYSIAASRASRHAANVGASRRRAGRRNSVRRKRAAHRRHKIAALENSVVPRLGFAAVLPKKIEIV